MVEQWNLKNILPALIHAPRLLWRAVSRNNSYGYGGLTDQLTELRLYVPLNTKYVISETFFPANCMAQYS